MFLSASLLKMMKYYLIESLVAINNKWSLTRLMTQESFFKSLKLCILAAWSIVCLTDLSPRKIKHLLTHWTYTVELSAQGDENFWFDRYMFVWVGFQNTARPMEPSACLINRKSRNDNCPSASNSMVNWMVSKKKFRWSINAHSCSRLCGHTVHVSSMLHLYKEGFKGAEAITNFSKSSIRKSATTEDRGEPMAKPLFCSRNCPLNLKYVDVKTLWHNFSLLVPERGGWTNPEFVAVGIIREFVELSLRKGNNTESRRWNLFKKGLVASSLFVKIQGPFNDGI